MGLSAQDKAKWRSCTGLVQSRAMEAQSQNEKFDSFFLHCEVMKASLPSEKWKNIPVSLKDDGRASQH